MLGRTRTNKKKFLFREEALSSAKDALARTHAHTHLRNHKHGHSSDTQCILKIILRIYLKLSAQYFLPAKILIQFLNYNGTKIRNDFLNLGNHETGDTN